MITAKENETLLEALASSLRNQVSSPDGMACPAAILFTDPKSQFLPLKQQLMVLLPELITLGEYDPSARTGPAIWIRCLVDSAIKSPALPDGRTPIIYLPGVARHDLRVGKDCREDLIPLVELIYRGSVWLQRNYSDWTVTAYLTSPYELGLDMDRSQATLDALHRALPALAEHPISHFTGRRLEADDFDKLLIDDPVRDLLRWMSSPKLQKERMESRQWEAFVSQCRQRFGFDPDRDGEIKAGELLGRGENSWASVWERFAEVPTAYPGIPGLLTLAQPQDLTLDRSRWPGFNEEEEVSLRNAFASLQELDHQSACDKIDALEQLHGTRRGWVWARLNHSPMAVVLEPLCRLARVARSPLGGTTPEDFAQAYAGGAWEADMASMQALALADASEDSLVRKTVRLLLKPWLEVSAQTFQQAAQAYPFLSRKQQPFVTATAGMCLLFTDGLRFDVAQGLVKYLEDMELAVKTGRRWAALPTITATAKPAVSPVADTMEGGILTGDMACHLVGSNKSVDAASLRTAVRAAGYQVIDSESPEPPQGDGATGWTEFGDLDRRGHDMEENFPMQIMPEIIRLAFRIKALLDLGWEQVRIVTDHGWLYLPGGLPKVELHKYLTEARWKRCAVIVGTSQTDAPKWPWHWNNEQYFVAAPGIACFNAAPAYAHGGLSIQECLLPDLTVTLGSRPVKAVIQSIIWRRMRCIVEADVTAGTISVDIRLNGPKGKTVAETIKRLDENGTASLVVDIDYEGKDLYLVLLDAQGEVLAQQKTKAGV